IDWIPKLCTQSYKVTAYAKSRAWTTAASRKGWWRKACTPAANEGMNARWFIQEGLEDLLARYLRLHPKETAVYESTHGGVRGR
ncbi:MAG: hypothetical protein AAFV07_20725, partial [Bacteroidota bacterium]